MTEQKPLIELPEDVQRAIGLVSGIMDQVFGNMMLKFKEYNKKSMGDYVENFAYFLAGAGFTGWIIQTIQYLMLIGMIP